MTFLVAYLALLQLVLPLVMIVLNAIVTPVTRLGFWARCAGLFALLIYLRLSGVWLFPPWWTPEDPKAYVIYGKQVLSPCHGKVVASLDGVPDMSVPQMDRDHMTGNHVIINCRADSMDSSGPNPTENSDRPSIGVFTVVLAHLAPGSIIVNTGDSIDTGAVVGRVGNSGNTAAPHLHIQVQSHLASDQPLSAAPL